MMLPLAAALLLALPAAAARPELEKELAKIVDLFYDLDLDKARAAADDIERRHPGHPAGPFYRGVSEYQRWVAEGMRSTSTMALVERDLDAAEAAAVALGRTDEAEGRYYYGAALGFRARLLASRRQYFKAMRQGVSAVKALKKAVALDPSLEDAKLGLGMFHYYAARMPAGARPLAYLLLGETGDRQKGLEELWAVARSTGVARMEARSMLSQILAKDDEADWAGADKLLVELAARYPRNAIYRLRRVYVALKRGDPQAAYALAEPDGEWLNRLHPAIAPPARAWALYRAAEAKLLMGKPAEAAPLIEALDKLDYPGRLKDWVLIRRGNLEDAAGRRDAADLHYARAEKGEKLPASVAERFRKEPYPKGPRDVAPFFTGY